MDKTPKNWYSLPHEYLELVKLFAKVALSMFALYLFLNLYFILFPAITFTH